MYRTKSVNNGGIAGVVAGFFTCWIGLTIGSWIEDQWNVVVVSWEMAALFVSIIVILGGYFAGSIGFLTKSSIIGGLIGAVSLGSALTAISLTNGSPREVAVWTISVGFFSGLTAGAWGGRRGNASQKKSVSENTKLDSQEE